MTSTKKARLVLPLLATGVLGVVLLRMSSGRDIARTFASVHGGWLLAAFASYVGLYLLTSLRWRVYSPRASVLTLARVSCLHMFWATILPLRAGEVSYVYLARTANLGSPAEATAALLVTRVAEFLFFGAAAGCAGLAIGSMHPGLMTWAVITFLVSVGAPLTAVVLLARRGGRWAEWLRGRPSGPRRLKAAGFIERLTVALRSGSNLRTLLPMAAWTAAIITSRYVVFFFLLRAFGLPVGLSATLIAGTIATGASIVPIQGFAGFGTLEGGWTAGLALVGVEVARGVAVAFGAHIATLLFLTLLASIAWVSAPSRGRPEAPDTVEHTGGS